MPTMQKRKWDRKTRQFNNPENSGKKSKYWCMLLCTSHHLSSLNCIRCSHLSKVGRPKQLGCRWCTGRETLCASGVWHSGWWPRRYRRTYPADNWFPAGPGRGHPHSHRRSSPRRPPSRRRGAGGRSPGGWGMPASERGKNIGLDPNKPIPQT